MTFYDHINKNAEKRIDVGSGFGPKPLLKETTLIILDVIVRKDRANDGIGVPETIEIVSDLNPNLSIVQIRNAFCHLRKTNKEYLSRVTKKPVVAQASTTKRNMIMVPQQWRWFQVPKILPLYKSSYLFISSSFRYVVF